MTTLILDGSNLCHEGQKKSGKFKTLGALLPCLRALLESGTEAWVIFDASFRHRLDKSSKAAREFETFLKKDERFRMAPAGTPADVFILEFAALRDFGVVSNDTFREYVHRKGKGKEPHFNGKPVRLHSFQMLMGAFVVPSLKISYLIDDDALDAGDIIAARADPSRLPEKPVPPDPARPAKSREGGARPPQAKPEAESESRSGQGPNPDAGPRPLDFLLELSPLFLRAGDVFDVHRRLTGKAWKAGNSKKSAAEFARECFRQPVAYEEPAGRKKNDGYFFDARYGDARHAEIRSHLLAANPKLLPLIASARGSVLRLLDLIHDGEFTSGFDFERLCARAEALGLAYYERYLRSLLYALIAADGVRGADEQETDIAIILKGEMRVNLDESQTDRLNFLQRGILYLLADADNNLPPVVRSNMGWMFQLPKDEKVRQAIIKGHLDWLALDEA